MRLQLSSFLATVLLVGGLVAALPQDVAGNAVTAPSKLITPISKIRTPLTRLNLPIPKTTATAKTFSNAFAETAFRKAFKLGIDPLGPKPTDFTSDNGQFISFEADSKFAVWAAAQNARTDVNALASAELDIVAWSSGTCTGGGRYYYNIGYNLNYWDPDFYDYSIQVSRRAINPAFERLWLKRWNGSDHCGIDLNWYVYGAPGCAQNLPPFSCFALRFQ